MKRLVIDLDGTLTVDSPGVPYPDKPPRPEVIAKLREYKAAGFAIVIATARNMRTFNNSVGHINAVTLPIVIDWLRKHDIPYDEIHVGKPWCGLDGFYVDDKAIRPSEFVGLGYDDIKALLAVPEKQAGGI
jgi:capsule biosynthesis phosphatase